MGAQPGTRPHYLTAYLSIKKEQRNLLTLKEEGNPSIEELLMKKAAIEIMMDNIKITFIPEVGIKRLSDLIFHYCEELETMLEKVLEEGNEATEEHLETLRRKVFYVTTNLRKRLENK